MKEYRETVYYLTDNEFKNSQSLQNGSQLSDWLQVATPLMPILVQLLTGHGGLKWAHEEVQTGRNALPVDVNVMEICSPAHIVSHLWL